MRQTRTFRKQIIQFPPRTAATNYTDMNQKNNNPTNIWTKSSQKYTWDRPTESTRPTEPHKNRHTHTHPIKMCEFSVQRAYNENASTILLQLTENVWEKNENQNRVEENIRSRNVVLILYVGPLLTNLLLENFPTWVWME